MNKIIFSIIFVMLSISYSSGTEQLTCEDCRDEWDGSDKYKKVPYFYCDPDNHEIVPVCTNGDPYNPPDPYSDWEPMKLCLPLDYGDDVTYDNSDVPWEDLGPWSEQIWANVYDDSFEYNDDDVPGLIEAALDFWQNICSPYNNDNCQDCDIKIAWSKDESKLGEDKSRPSHVSNPLVDGECNYDCSELGILLNASSGFSQVNADGKPLKYFFTRGADMIVGYGSFLVNADLRTEMIHQLGILLGFANTFPDDNPGCGPSAYYSTAMHNAEFDDEYWRSQESRLNALDNTSSIDPPYDFLPKDSEYSTYDRCVFKLLYCCEEETSISSKNMINPIFNIIPNPAADKVTIRLSVNEPGICDVSIYNLYGDKVLSPVNGKILEPGNYSYEIGLGSFAGGLYYCVFLNNNKKLSKSLIILE